MELHIEMTEGCIETGSQRYYYPVETFWYIYLVVSLNQGLFLSSTQLKAIFLSTYFSWQLMHCELGHLNLQR